MRYTVCEMSDVVSRGWTLRKVGATSSLPVAMSVAETLLRERFEPLLSSARWVDGPAASMWTLMLGEQWTGLLITRG